MQATTEVASPQVTDPQPKTGPLETPRAIGPYATMEACLEDVKGILQDGNGFCQILKGGSDLQPTDWFVIRKEWPNGRILESFISSEVLDKQGEKVPLKRLLTTIPFLVIKGYYEWMHDGIPIGEYLAFKFDIHPLTNELTVKVRVGIKASSDPLTPPALGELFDQCWEQMKSIGLAGESSIRGVWGGDMKCVGSLCYTEVKDMGVFAVGYVGRVPGGAQPMADVTFLSGAKFAPTLFKTKAPTALPSPPAPAPTPVETRVEKTQDEKPVERDPPTFLERFKSRLIGRSVLRIPKSAKDAGDVIVSLYDLVTYHAPKKSLDSIVEAIWDQIQNDDASRRTIRDAGFTKRDVRRLTKELIQEDEADEEPTAPKPAEKKPTEDSPHKDTEPCPACEYLRSQETPEDTIKEIHEEEMGRQASEDTAEITKGKANVSVRGLEALQQILAVEGPDSDGNLLRKLIQAEVPRDEAIGAVQELHQMRAEISDSKDSMDMIFDNCVMRHGVDNWQALIDCMTEVSGSREDVEAYLEQTHVTPAFFSSSRTSRGKAFEVVDEIANVLGADAGQIAEDILGGADPNSFDQETVTLIYEFAYRSDSQGASGLVSRIERSEFSADASSVALRKERAKAAEAAVGQSVRIHCDCDWDGETGQVLSVVSQGPPTAIYMVQVSAGPLIFYGYELEAATAIQHAATAGTSQAKDELGDCVESYLTEGIAEDEEAALRMCREAGWGGPSEESWNEPAMEHGITARYSTARIQTAKQNPWVMQCATYASDVLDFDDDVAVAVCEQLQAQGEEDFETALTYTVMDHPTDGWDDTGYMSASITRQKAITCRYCGKTIRGNAAAEDYDPVTGQNKYTCPSCARVFKDVESGEYGKVGIPRWMWSEKAYMDPDALADCIDKLVAEGYSQGEAHDGCMDQLAPDVERGEDLAQIASEKQIPAGWLEECVGAMLGSEPNGMTADAARDACIEMYEQAGMERMLSADKQGSSSALCDQIWTDRFAMHFGEAAHKEFIERCQDEGWQFAASGMRRYLLGLSGIVPILGAKQGHDHSSSCFEQVEDRCHENPSQYTGGGKPSSTCEEAAHRICYAEGKRIYEWLTSKELGNEYDPVTVESWANAVLDFWSKERGSAFVSPKVPRKEDDYEECASIWDSQYASQYDEYAAEQWIDECAQSGPASADELLIQGLASISTSTPGASHPTYSRRRRKPRKQDELSHTCIKYWDDNYGGLSLQNPEIRAWWMTDCGSYGPMVADQRMLEMMGVPMDGKAGFPSDTSWSACMDDLGADPEYMDASEDELADACLRMFRDENDQFVAAYGDEANGDVPPQFQAEEFPLAKAERTIWHAGNELHLVSEFEDDDAGRGIDEAQALLDYYRRAGIDAAATHYNGRHQVYAANEWGDDFEEFIGQEFEFDKVDLPLQGKPFAGYTNWAECVADNQDADDPDALCGYLKREHEGKAFPDEDKTLDVLIAYEGECVGVETPLDCQMALAAKELGIEETEMVRRVAEISMQMKAPDMDLTAVFDECTSACDGGMDCTGGCIAEQLGVPADQVMVVLGAESTEAKAEDITKTIIECNNEFAQAYPGMKPSYPWIEDCVEKAVGGTVSEREIRRALLSYGMPDTAYPSAAFSAETDMEKDSVLHLINYSELFLDALDGKCGDIWKPQELEDCLVNAATRAHGDAVESIARIAARAFVSTSLVPAGRSDLVSEKQEPTVAAEVSDCTKQWSMLHGKDGLDEAAAALWLSGCKEGGVVYAEAIATGHLGPLVEAREKSG